ncbi:hypothetical protein BAUCODRAFT_398985 [Baudoinia panamericana UAMH 10762]|uniref:Uncharacterized protein n=1 Tax=Baudoinia panamericana (strain UAMH 10762) TaxID=717646 RepID=M2NJJ5_BAUPA|nr:uncharacterized protein BAUCODRAFT_398985 [Baudoinia panamericana UAMH 10762]EMC99315.1 hypothetical protein BAUCODRAFT_398985 [Baudoinia panamericana UAMH 10762]
MGSRQDRPSPFVLGNKPSSSFSSISSAGSATSAATSRSGGSKLLFGEIDQSSDRSSESFASVCSFVLCDSGTFLKFWLDDICRDRFLSYVPRADLANIRLSCHDFSVRAAPALFSDLSITFRTGTFTKPATVAALDRVGCYVNRLTFNVPHTLETFLPPLIEPDTGEELSFTYTPQIQIPSATRPKYGDAGTTEVLTRQWPALFHAATNVPAFVRVFSALINLNSLQISCPGYEPSMRRRRSVVDFVLISLRIAVEQNCLNALNTLALAPIHPGALLYLLPTVGYGATPRSLRAWSRIRHLRTAVEATAASGQAVLADDRNLLQAYIAHFQANLESIDFLWHGQKGAWPFPHALVPNSDTHPALRMAPAVNLPTHSSSKPARPLYFQQLRNIKVANTTASASDIQSFVETHRCTLEDVDLEDVELGGGTWDDALAPLTRQDRHRTNYADIPIMLSPTAAMPTIPALADSTGSVTMPEDRRSSRVPGWLSSRRSKPLAVRKVREGLHGCEEGLKKMLAGVLPWK